VPAADDSSARAPLGLARSAARLGDTARACEGYRQVAQVTASDFERQEAGNYLARCP